MTSWKPRLRTPALVSDSLPTSSTYLPLPPMSRTNSCAASCAPWELLETICAAAMPVALISRSIRKLGMPASLAFVTAPIEASAPALSRMIAATLREIATSISWVCLFGSSSCELTSTS